MIVNCVCVVALLSNLFRCLKSWCFACVLVFFFFFSCGVVDIVCVVRVLIACVCLVDGVIDRRCFCCYLCFLDGVVVTVVMVVLVGDSVVHLFVILVIVVIGVFVIGRVLLLVLLKSLWFVCALLHCPRTCLGIRNLGDLLVCFLRCC